jgi:hypothetical protein
MTEGGLPIDDGMAKAVRALFCPEYSGATEDVDPLGNFQFGEPEESKGYCGYSVSRDVLWVRTHRFFGEDESRPQSSGMEAVQRLLEVDRYLWPRLQRFVGSHRWLEWQQKPVRARQPELSADDEEVFKAIAHDHGPTRIGYRGALLIGHDAKRMPGVYVIGARWQTWLANESQEERLKWLLWPADLVAPMLGDLDVDDLSFCLPGLPVVELFAGEPLALRSMGRALLTWHANEAPDPWYWRRRRHESEKETRIEVIRLGKERTAACFLPYVKDHSEATVHVRGALADERCRGTAPDDGVLLLVSGLPLEKIERAIGAVMSAELGLVGGLRFKVVDRHAIEALARRYPWVWDLELAAINEGQALSYAASPPCVWHAEALMSNGRDAEALAGLRSLIAFPWAQTDRAVTVQIVLALVEAGRDRPWTMVGDVVRALRPEFRRAWYGELNRGIVSVKWWVTVLPSRILEVVPGIAWAPAPAIRSREWHGFVRLLRCWRTMNADNAAAKLANGVREKLLEQRANTAALDAAWAESQPPELGAGLGVKEPAIWSALRMQRDI